MDTTDQAARDFAARVGLEWRPKGDELSEEDPEMHYRHKILQHIRAGRISRCDLIKSDKIYIEFKVDEFTVRVHHQKCDLDKAFGTVHNFMLNIDNFEDKAYQKYRRLCQSGQIKHHQIKLFKNGIFRIKLKIPILDDNNYYCDSFIGAIQHRSNAKCVIRFEPNIPSSWRSHLHLRVDDKIRPGVYQLFHLNVDDAQIRNHELYHSTQLSAVMEFSMGTVDTRSWITEMLKFYPKCDPDRDYIFVIPQRGGFLEEFYHGMVEVLRQDALKAAAAETENDES